MTFLAIDVGNTRLKWALYDAPRPGATLLAHGAEFLEHIERLAEHSWAQLPTPHQVLGCVVAGDAIKRRVEEQLQAWGLKPRWLVAGLRGAGVVNGYDHPHRLGADRWAALVGARQQALAVGGGGAQAGTPAALVIMVGTAVTIDALDADGHFLGGAIMPGFGLMLRALETGTAGLKVPMGQATEFPTNTSDALTSGGTDAIAGAIERAYRRLARRAGAEPLLLMSGGAAPKLALLADELPLRIVDHLIFEGLLALAADRAPA